MKRSKNKSNWFVSTSLVFFLTYQIIKEKFIHGWKGEDKRYELLASWVLARSPTAIAVNPANDHILLSYWSNCWIEEYSPDGTIVRNIGGSMLSSPTALAVDETTEEVVVVDGVMCTITILSPTNGWKAIGSKPLQVGPLKSPHGVALDPLHKGNIVIANTGFHCVHVLSTISEKIILTIGTLDKKGSQDGEFQNPFGVAVDPKTGNIIVSDTGNHRVQIFSHEGAFIRKFGEFGEKDDQFRSPKGIVVAVGLRPWSPEAHRDYPEEFKDIVKAMLMMALLDSDTPIHPEAPWYLLPMELMFQIIILLSTQYNNVGEIIVADADNHRIQIFSTEGKWRATINGPAGDTRAVAVSANRIIVPDGTRVKVYA